MTDRYDRLRRRLDDFSSGYPRTAGGVEIRILKRLFSEEEADLFLHLYPLLETAAEVAGRLNRDPDETGRILASMAKKGLLFRLQRSGRPRYCAIPFVPGIYDFQVRAMDRTFAQQVEAYTQAGFGKTIQGYQTPILRTIPVNRRLVARWPIAPFEDALGIIDAQRTIAVAPCICRTKSGLLNGGCDKPLETCLLFGDQAAYYLENRLGRPIDKAEAKQILEMSDEAGLVIQPFNAQEMGVMCNCCGDCCEMLGSLKRQPVPSAAVKSNYFARGDADRCSGCGLCVSRCQMDAATLVGDRIAIDLDRCIGCGLCVSTCPTTALALIRKAEGRRYLPPASTVETFMRLAQERRRDLLPHPP